MWNTYMIKEIWHTKNHWLLLFFYNLQFNLFWDKRVKVLTWILSQVLGLYIIWNSRKPLQNLTTDNFSKILSVFYYDPYHVTYICKTQGKNSILISKGMYAKCLNTLFGSQKLKSKSSILVRGGDLFGEFSVVYITCKHVKFGRFL